MTELAQLEAANLTIPSPPYQVTVTTQTQPNNTSISVPTSKAVSKLVEEFKDLCLNLVQGQNPRTKSPLLDRLILQWLVQFVTCHGCGKKGHYKSNCPDTETYRANPRGASTSETKAVEVNLLKLISKGLSEERLEVMMTKRTRPTHDIEPPMRAHHKRSKGQNEEGPSHHEHVKRTRRKIGIKDLFISRGQKEYSIISYLSQQTTNITVG